MWYMPCEFTKKRKKKKKWAGKFRKQEIVLNDES